jgi:hypothetical protein
MEFGQRMLISSNLQEIFWNDSKQQKENIQNIINTIGSSARGVSTSYHLRQAFLIIHKFTQQAITNHERMVAGTASRENANSIIYTDRRANLLKCNESTRKFMRQLKQADVHRNLNLDVDELKMELCRMALWNPQNAATRYGNNWLEVTILQNARQALSMGNLDQCKDYCIRLLQEDWRSLFAECAAKSILFTLGKDVLEGWVERLAELQNVMVTLESLKAPAPAYWQNEMVALRAEAAGLVSSRATGIPLSCP